MTTNTNSDYPLAPVQFSRLTKRGIMLGLSLPQLVVLGVAILAVVASLYTGGGMGLAWTSPLWSSAALVAVIPAGGCGKSRARSTLVTTIATPPSLSWQQSSSRTTGSTIQRDF